MSRKNLEIFRRSLMMLSPRWSTWAGGLTFRQSFFSGKVFQLYDNLHVPCHSTLDPSRGSGSWHTVENAYGGLGQCSTSPLRSLFWREEEGISNLLLEHCPPQTYLQANAKFPAQDLIVPIVCAKSFGSQIGRSPAPKGEMPAQATWDAFKKLKTNRHRVDVSLSDGHWVGVT